MKNVMLLVVMCLLAACSTPEIVRPSAATEAALKGYNLGEPVEGIYNYNINGWQYVSEYSLIIPSGPRHNYLLLLDRPCRDLRATEVIATTSTVNQLRAGFDSIVVKTASKIADKCRVKEIYRISKAKPADA